MTSRVPMVSLERARELGDAMGMPARRTTSEAFRMVANNPGVARVAFGQLMQLLENNKFDTRLREMMIMRIGWVTGSAYEWTQHWRVATTAGIPPEDILAVRDWRNSRASDGGGQGDPGGDRRVPRRQIHLGRRPGPRWRSTSPIPDSRLSSSSPWATGCRFRCCSAICAFRWPRG